MENSEVVCAVSISGKFSLECTTFGILCEEDDPISKGGLKKFSIEKLFSNSGKLQKMHLSLSCWIQFLIPRSLFMVVMVVPNSEAWEGNAGRAFAEQVSIFVAITELDCFNEFNWLNCSWFKEIMGLVLTRLCRFVCLNCPT